MLFGDVNSPELAHNCNWFSALHFTTPCSNGGVFLKGPQSRPLSEGMCGELRREATLRPSVASPPFLTCSLGDLWEEPAWRRGLLRRGGEWCSGLNKALLEVDELEVDEAPALFLFLF